MILTSKYLPLYGGNFGENLIAGFNIHYLPFEIARQLIKVFTNNPQAAIKIGLQAGTTKLVYRNYKIKGIKSARKIDWRGFVSKISIMRQLKPAEREALIKTVEQQLASNPKDLFSINRSIAQMLEGRSSTVRPTPGIVPPTGGVM